MIIDTINIEKPNIILALGEPINWLRITYVFKPLAPEDR